MVDFFSLFPDVKKQNYYNRNLPTTIGGSSIGPFQNRTLLTSGNRGRSILDNIYGLSANPSIQANPPSRFRTANMGGYKMLSGMGQGKRRTFERSSLPQFLDPNVNNPYLRNNLPIPQPVNEDELLKKIPAHLRQYAKIVNGQVVFDMPEELETPGSIPGVSNQPNIEQANKGILNVQENTNQENIETANKGILSKDKKEKSSFSGLLKNAFDKGVEFAQSDYGMDFFMGMDTGYSDTPKTLLETIKPGYEYAEAKQQQEIENEIKKQRAKTDNYREPVYRALVRDKQGNQYGLFSSKGQLYADVNGVRIPQQQLEKVIGPYDIRNVGDQMDGVISFSKFRTLNKEIIDDEISLKKYVKFLQEVDKSGVGYERLINNFTAKMKTFFSTKSKQYGLTEEELAQQIANGNLQGLLGSSRKEVVGGGVLTEQDARRVIEYLGGDVSAFNNPARVQDAISVVFRDKYDKYINNLNDYNIGVQNEYGTRGYKTKEQIKFTDPQLELLDAGITVEMGLRNFNDLSQEELLAIDTSNLSIEKYDQYIKALERFVE